MRILFVENHATFAQVVVGQFLAGHEVVVASSIADARGARGPFDAVLVDYDLDDGKGDVLVRELVASGYPGRIIAVSARPAGNEALLAAGAHVVCPKASMSQLSSLLAGI